MALIPACSHINLRSNPTPPPSSPTPDQLADQLVAQMTLDEKLQLVHGALTIQNPVGPNKAEEWVPGIQRLGIPDLLYADGPVGVDATLGPATALPSSIASAASWDTAEAYKYGSIIGTELRSYGMNVWLGGNVNLTSGREPRDGRTFETAGEDPLLAGSIKAQHLLAVQDQDLIGTLKHYALNDQETGRLYANAIIDDRSARESDLLAFEVALKESSAQSVMCSYNLINSVYACQNDDLLNGILKTDWQFPGFVASDAFATESSVSSAVAGLDQEQIGGYFFGGAWGTGLESAINSGQMPLSRLDNMVHRVVRAMIAAGPYSHPAAIGKIDETGDAAVAQDILEQGAVLLKNTPGLLPLNAGRIPSIAIIGGHADVGVLSGGGSAQVAPEGGVALTLPPECPPTSTGVSGQACLNSSEVFDPSSPLAAIRDRAPQASVQFADGTDLNAAAALAKSSTVAIVFVTQWTSEGMDLPGLNLPDNQDALVSAVTAANPDTVIVIESGGAVLMPWLPSAGAVLETWYAGQRGAQAIARILFGDVNPSGKLPITFPGSVADLPRPVIPGPSDASSTSPFEVDYSIEGLNVGYKWFDAKIIQPQFPFGFGLSYTTFSISNPAVTPNTTGTAPGFVLEFAIKNTGTVAGAEVAQVYLGFRQGAGEPPRRLVAWKKILLKPGEEGQESITVSASDFSHPFSYWDSTSGGWQMVQGAYTVYVGNSSRNLAVAGTFTPSQ